MSEFHGDFHENLPPPLPPPLPNKNIDPFNSDFRRYKKASKIIESKIIDDSAYYDRIQNNTVEAMMYLSNNIEELKYLSYDAKLKHRYIDICTYLKNTFGELDYTDIKAFLHKNGIYNYRFMTIIISIFHWILFTAIYTTLCQLNDISLFLYIFGFLGMSFFGVFTNILFLTILDTSFHTYKLSPRYNALRKYKARP